MNKRKSHIIDDQIEIENEDLRSGFKQNTERSNNIIEINKFNQNNKKEKVKEKPNSFNIVFSQKNKESGKIEDLENKVQKLENVIAEKNKIIEELTNKYIETQRQKIKIKENEEKQKDKLINDLRNEIIENKKMFYEFNEKMRYKENSIEHLSFELEKLTKENSNLKQKIQELSKNKNLPQINNNVNNNNFMNQNNNINNNLINNNNLGFNNNNINNNNINNNSVDLNQLQLGNINLDSNKSLKNKNIILNNNDLGNNFINNNNQNNINNIHFNNNNAPFNQNNQKKENLNQIIIPQKIIIQPIQQYLKPTLVGLQNIGATCFMNATLQCLSQTQKLTNYFLKSEHLQKIINNNIAQIDQNSYQLSPVYLELIQNLWSNNGLKYYAPYNFMKRVNDMNPLFKKGEAGDAKDFIIFVLEQMHKELKKPLKLNNINADLPINQYDKHNTLLNFFNEFTKETSVLSDLFFGFNETTNVCLNCKQIYISQNKPFPICYNYGIFNVLIFPLEEVKNLKNSMNLMNFQNFYQGPTNTVNIDDCFIYNQKTDLFTGENKNYCNICKQLCDSEYTSRIYICPDYLILILNRGKGNKFKVKMDFNFTIDITNYILQKEKNRMIYNLYGVITHIGESGPNAHFIASCKSPVDGKWYRYNDAMVDIIKDFNAEVYNYGVPYILFYEKTD